MISPSSLSPEAAIPADAAPSIPVHTAAPLPSWAWPHWPAALRRELRTDHAGEAGAVMIYRGVLALARDPALRAFAQQHLHTEAQHLAWVEAVVPRAGRSRLLPLWRVAGWLTGALPACIGPRAVYLTIEAVETFVDHHYAAQLVQIDALRPAAAPELQHRSMNCGPCWPPASKTSWRTATMPAHAAATRPAAVRARVWLPPGPRWSAPARPPRCG